MKKLLKLFLLMGAALLPTAAGALNMSGKHYQGIAKNANGDPVELWVDIEFDDEDASVNIGDIYSFISPYKAAGTGNNATISTKMPGFGTPINFKTTDGGSSLTATFVEPNKNMQLNLWLLKVPRRLKKVEQDEEEIIKAITSADGYTCFLQIKRGGSTYCITSDARFTREGEFRAQQDSKKLEEMFEPYLNGTYRVEDGEFLVSLSDRNFQGEIYDKGNYIKVPLGRLNGPNPCDVTIILIK